MQLLFSLLLFIIGCVLVYKGVQFVKSNQMFWGILCLIGGALLILGQFGSVVAYLN